jgi:group I intron endonuclease
MESIPASAPTAKRSERAALAVAPAVFPATSGIYRIVHVQSGKCYIGLAKDLRRRMREHLATIANGKSRLYRAIRKYGPEAFRAEVVELCAPDELKRNEVFWVGAYNSLSPRGYNLTRGGEDSPMNHPETRAKHAANSAAAGRKRSENPVWRANVAAANRKRAEDPVWRAKNAATNRKRAEDPVWRENTVAAILARPSSSRCSVAGQTYNSFRQACWALGLDLCGHQEARSKMVLHGSVEFRGHTFTLAPMEAA